MPRPASSLQPGVRLLCEYKVNTECEINKPAEAVELVEAKDGQQTDEERVEQFSNSYVRPCLEMLQI